MVTDAENSQNLKGQNKDGEIIEEFSNMDNSKEFDEKRSIITSLNA